MLLNYALSFEINDKVYLPVSDGSLTVSFMSRYIACDCLGDVE